MNFIIENWQIVGLLLGSGGGGGWLGYVLASKSRKIDLQTKIFQMQSEMIDSVKKDFEDRISYLEQYIGSLKKEINKKLEFIDIQSKIIEDCKKQKEECEEQKKRLLNGK